MTPHPRTGTLSRRTFLAGLAGSALPLAGLHCPWSKGPDLPDLEPIPGGGKAVDVHAHIFNAKDLPIQGFAKNVVLRQGFGFLEGPVKALDFALRLGSKSYHEEKRLLDRLLSGEEAAASELRDLDPPDDLLDQFVTHMNANDRRSMIRIYDEENVQVGVESGGALRGSAVERALRWGHLLTKYRVQIARKLLDTYPQVQLFTPALVDMDAWLGDDDADTSIAKQVDLYGRIVRWGRGRIHPFVAYDPYRQLNGGNSLADVQTAVRSHGFVGVKLYPPMGFRPWSNAELYRATDVRHKLDEALGALYAWCESKDVPIMAHCNASNGADVRYGDRADPYFWGQVLQRHPGLRLSLGHFGGADDLRQNASRSWAFQIGELMARFPNVYADTGYHGIALDAGPQEIEGYFRQLARLRAAHPVLEARLLYGSDWQMILMARGWESYRETSLALAREHLGETAARRFAGYNALRYLGLDSDTKNRRRLQKFYADNGMQWPPPWAAA